MHEYFLEKAESYLLIFKTYEGIWICGSNNPRHGPLFFGGIDRVPSRGDGSLV
jgi:hypothetical protein